MTAWKRQEYGDLIAWICEGLREQCGVEAAITTRHGGVSPEPWSTLNFGRRVGDDPQRVAQNWQTLFQAIDTDASRVRCAEQVHGILVRVTGDQAFPWVEPGADGLIDFHGEHVLMTFHADCTPVFLAMRTSKATALVHAGWKGTVDGIVREAVRSLCRLTGGSPYDVFAAIGPCIRGCCYEVGDEVIQRLRGRFGDETRGILVPGRQGKNPHLELAAANRHWLRQEGIPDDHIMDAGLCTACQPGDFFSHRRDRGKTGRMVAWLRRLD